MMLRWTQTLLLVFTFAATAFANLEMTGVATTYDASSSTTYTVSWEDDGTGTTVPVSEVETVTLLLCTYSSDESVECIATSSGMLSSYAVNGKTTASFTFTSTQAAWGVDGYGYFLQLTAVVKASEYYQCYSDFVTMSGMTGVKGVNVSPSTGPGTVPSSSGNEATSLTPSQISSLVSLSYTAQTLKTRVAPMQMQPGTAVTMSLSPSARYPTSAVTYFKSPSPSPSVWSTITVSWSYTFTPYINYAATKSGPTLVLNPTAVRQSYIAGVSKLANARRRRWVD